MSCRQTSSSSVHVSVIFFLSVIFRSITTDLDEISMTVGGGVKLTLVFGDITNETTDGIVNTTDFVNFHDGR